ncbi:MAG: hypothetical protein PHO32_02630 [Candidatus Cloacimonetes bacterium]|nr:hypothetical protein [Candidatus Cloacimonadota bacterium]
MKYYALLFVALMVLLGACDIKKPTLPKWDIELSVPLINDTLFVSDLASGDNITVDEDSILTLVGDGDNNTDQFGNVPFSFQQSINDVPVPGTGYEGAIPLVDSQGRARLVYGVFFSGAFRTRVTNVNPNVEQIKITFPQLTRTSGTPLKIVYNGDSDWVDTSLAGLKIGNVESQQLLGAMDYIIEVSPALPQGTMAAEFSFSTQPPFSFSLFKGTLQGMRSLLKTQSTGMSIEYPLDIDQAVTLENAKLRITLVNYIGFAAEFRGRFLATNAEGDTVSIPIEVSPNQYYHTVPASPDGEPGIRVMEFTNNVRQLLQIMPKRVEIISGVFTVNSGNTIGTVRSTDHIDTIYRIQAPLTVTLHNHAFVIRSERKIEISEENRNRIRDNAISAELTMMVQNKLPVGAWAQTYFSQTPDIDINDPATYDYVKLVQISSYETNPGFQEVKLSLSNEEMQLFTNPLSYMRWAFSFDESEHPITIYATYQDFIHLKGMLQAKILVEDLQ